jgi:hypothetical protein
MEALYLEKNLREFEITKSISMFRLNPMAVMQLRETGTCNIELNEELFDVDYPGHYLRRIKSVSLTIPCVVGPYASVNWISRLLNHSTRVDSSFGGAADPYALLLDGNGNPDRGVRNVTVLNRAGIRLSNGLPWYRAFHESELKALKTARE